MTKIIEIERHASRESEVRSYCRTFPTVFEKAKDSYLWDESGKRYIDFFSGAGAINYGHNNPRMRKALVDYLSNDGVVHSLDMATTAKRSFINAFDSVILQPRNLDYKLQFTGPGGTNAVETALKIARLSTGRSNIAAFTNGYHGLTTGALAITSNPHYRNEAFTNRSNACFLPYDGYFGPAADSIGCIQKLIADPGSGIDLPAAIILETIQAEGGVNVASMEWLRALEVLCRKNSILLIIDDIQVGCGRTGSFFSFEEAGIQPDIVILSKAISGFGLPMSVVLMKPELDVWKPGEETATFRGHNLSFVTALKALEYWEDPAFSREIQEKGMAVQLRLERLIAEHPAQIWSTRGIGLIHGIQFESAELARKIQSNCFQRGLVIELCGPRNNVMKLLPPLTISMNDLNEGIDLLQESLESALNPKGILLTPSEL